MVRVVLTVLSMLVLVATAASAAPQPTPTVPEVIDPSEPINVGPDLIGDGSPGHCTPGETQTPETSIRVPGFHVESEDEEVFGVDPIDVVTIGSITLPPDAVYIPAVIITTGDGQTVATPAIHLTDVPFPLPVVCYDP